MAQSFLPMISFDYINLIRFFHRNCGLILFTKMWHCALLRERLAKSLSNSRPFLNFLLTWPNIIMHHGNLPSNSRHHRRHHQQQYDLWSSNSVIYTSSPSYRQQYPLYYSHLHLQCDYFHQNMTIYRGYKCCPFPLMVIESCCLNLFYHFLVHC